MSWRYTLDSSQGPLVIKDTPIGWADKRFTMAKSENYGGSMITVSANLIYITDAYDYLVELENLEGIMGVCTIKIESKINDVIGWGTEFEGFLDFKEKTQIGRAHV